jgi:hypothetical protein
MKDALGDLGDADVLAGEDAPEIHFSVLEADLATAGDGEGVVVKGIGELLKSAVDARGARVEVGGDFHS